MTKTLKGRLVLTGIASVLSGAVLGGGCQTTGPVERVTPNAEDGGSTTPCQQAFGAACGSPCSEDAPCPTGLYCGEGVCKADCIAESDCEHGTCSAEGRCEQIEDSGTPNISIDAKVTDPDAMLPDAPTCVEGQVEFAAVMPQVWLLLDRSGSMTSLLETTSRWDALGAVIVGDPADASDRGIVGAFEDRAAFGAVFYTSGSSSTGCVLDLESIAPAANNYTKIRQRYNKIGPTGGTPTADAIAATVAVASTSDLTGGPKILVLATDGAPGGCAPRDQTATLEVEGEVVEAFGKGVKTFAVSIATETDATHMQRVANLGVGLAADADPPAPCYTAETQDELALAFSTILEDVPRSCVFSLNGEVDAEEADQGTVTLAGVELVYGDENGWVLKQADQVELIGTACDQIQAGEEDLDITFPCDVFTPVVK